MTIKRQFSFLLIIALLLSFIFNSFAADALVTINSISDKRVGDTVTVSGTNSMGTISIKVIRPDTTVLYINTVKGTDYSDSFAIPSDAATGKYTVVAGQGTTVATTTFNVVPPAVPVTGVTLNKATLSLVAGTKGFLTATLAPTNATNKTISYTSSQPSVATVDSTSGTVTAVAAGTATITVTTADGSKTATCEVTVTAAPASITINSITDKRPGEAVTVSGTNNLGTISIKVIKPDTTVLYVNTVNETNYSDTLTIPSNAALGKYTVVVGQGTTIATTTFNVVSPVAVTGVTLNKATLNLVAGTKGFLTATLVPTNATNKTISYASSNPSVATVDSTSGTVTAVAAGTATITVTTADGSKTATCEVTVTAAPASITINSITDKRPGEAVTVSGTNNLGTISIKVIKPDTTVLYVNTVNETNYSDTLTIPSNAALGKYTVVVGQGTTIATTTFNVVSPVAVTGVTLNKATLNLVAGTKGFLTATLVPTNATNKTISYASSNPSVATVDSTSGTVTAVAAGTATITVTTADGSKTATCEVTVTAAPASITINSITDKRPGEAVTVSGTNNLGTISIKVIKPDTTVLYVNTVNETNYSDTLTIPSNAALGKYTVVVGQGTTIATTTFNVVSPVAVTGVTLNKATLNLVAGTKGFLTATLVPTNATNKTISYASSNPSVATVDSTSGTVTAVAAGTATITVTTADGSKTATCEVTVTAAPASITINSITDKRAGEKVTISGTNNLGNISIKVIRPDNTVLYINTANDRNYSDTFTIPSDAANGVYTVVVGQGSNVASTTFNVVPPVAVTGVTLNKATLNLVAGTKGFLTATLVPTNATNKTISYASSNPSVATVDSTSGTVTAVAAGTATITVTTADGSKTATCEVTVTAAPASITINSITDKRAGEKVTISGTNNLGNISIKVIRPDNTVLYINTANDRNYSDTFTIPSDAANGVYTVVVGQGTTVATTTFKVVSSGGGTGGNGGGTPSTPTTPDQTSGVDNGVILINIKSDANGLVDAKIKDSDMDAVISGAKDNTVKIQIKSDANAKSINVSISGQQIKKAIDKNIEKITIDTGFTTITVPTDLIKQNMKNESDELKLNINKVDTTKLSKEVQDTINQGVAYDFTMMIGTRTISNFENVGQITVSIKYDLKPGENAEKVILYYVDDNGKLEIVMNARYDEKTGNINFTPKHFSKYAAAHSKVTFSDIDKPTWAKVNIEALAARGIVAGVGDNKFNPYGNVTRAEFIQMLMKAFELNDSSASTTFSDVKDGAWYYNSIATAQKLGIVSGKKDGSFGVTDQITRQDMAVMLYKTAKIAKINLESKSVEQFTDKDKISGYAIEAVEAMQKAGIVSGVGSGSYAPANKSTRAEASTIIFNLFSVIK